MEVVALGEGPSPRPYCRAGLPPPSWGVGSRNQSIDGRFQMGTRGSMERRGVLSVC